MVEKQRLQDQIISISRDYLGPASERFIERQVLTHLNKTLEEITKTDLINLADWIRMSFSLLTKDGNLVDEYIARLLKVAGAKPNVRAR